jgi:hypothetical protein
MNKLANASNSTENNKQKRKVVGTFQNFFRYNNEYESSSITIIAELAK